ncbi:exporter of polyketide antibiotics [Actinoplanes sp. OR16]|uniref:ABC transporter permease n=1 Tax=Actinoplanes sp. OR16 TaxID=946334 RepID=UPI000F6CB30B|nr:ABC transporter permease [Actinoplanes sp. OR16]BBH65867.1 exporter of polyketide antibiotics [Actinoplanes sp. OR16]
MRGVFSLLRLALRRDRVIMPLWVLGFGLLPYLYLSAFDSLFTTVQERVDYARISSANSGFIALYGPLRGSSLGELVVWRAGFVPVMIGLAALLTVIRHTRADDEAGRTELIRATVVGRYAQLAAALILTGGASLLTGVIVAVTMPLPGSIALGVVFTLSGWMFAGIGAVAAQVSGSARSARSLAVVALAVSYVLRLGGDVSASFLAWLSPIGWVHRVFPYGETDRRPVTLALLFVVLSVSLSAYLLARRDVGAGLIASRLGPASAAASLSTPPALAWRLHRGLLLGWTAGFAALGLLFGGVGSSVVQLAADSRGVDEMFSRIGGGGAVTDAYFATTAAICGLVAACYAVQAALRMRDEEQTGHAEAVLTTSVGRLGWALSHLLFALLGPAVALLAEGLLAGLVHGDVGPVLGASLAQLPAVWVLAGMTMLLIGAAPRFAPAAWAVLAACLLVLLVGPLLNVSQWVLDLSPFTHVPHLPGGTFTSLPLAVLLGVAVLLGTIGLSALRRRDITA